MKGAQISAKLQAMRCHVLIPHLFWPDPVFRIEALPHLETLLARGERTRTEGQSLEEWLCRAYLVRPQQDWPVAPLSLSVGAEDLDYWLRADPVHMQVRRDHLVLLGADMLSISDAEAEAITAALNRHFESDGLHFAFEKPDIWLVRLPEPPHLATTPISQVIGRDITASLPKGVDAMRWNHILNEIQMLLHDHPVNDEREKAGRLTINSVWFWGGGISPDVRQTPFASIASNNSVARGLAKQSATPHFPVPENAEAWLAKLGTEGEHLVILEDLFFPSKYGDGNAWDERLRALEANWFAPLHQGVQQGMVLTLSDNEKGFHFETSRLDLWKFWKRSRPILDYAR